MGLSDGRKGFRIGLAVLIQYRSVTDTQPPSHVAVAITLYAVAPSAKINFQFCVKHAQKFSAKIPKSIIPDFCIDTNNPLLFVQLQDYSCSKRYIYTADVIVSHCAITISYVCIASCTLSSPNSLLLLNSFSIFSRCSLRVSPDIVRTLFR